MVNGLNPGVSTVRSYCVIIRVRVFLKRTVVGDRRFDNLSRSHLQSQANSVYLSMMLYFLVRFQNGRSH